jgi:hypothetical protein
MEPKIVPMGTTLAMGTTSAEPGLTERNSISIMGAIRLNGLKSSLIYSACKKRTLSNFLPTDNQIMNFSKTGKTSKDFRR